MLDEGKYDGSLEYTDTLMSLNPLLSLVFM